MGAIAYWRECTNPDAGPDVAPKYKLRCEILKESFHMWDGSKKDQKTGKRKAEETQEPEDYVSAETCVCGCDLPAVPRQHGNVDAELFEKFCFELAD